MKKNLNEAPNLWGNSCGGDVRPTISPNTNWESWPAWVLDSFRNWSAVNQRYDRRKWPNFAEYCGVPRRAATRLIAEQAEALEPARRLFLASYLSDPMKQQYDEFLRINTSVLTA